MFAAQVIIGSSLIVLAAVFAMTYAHPNANGLTRFLAQHWKEPPIPIPGTRKRVPYEWYFLGGAVLLLVLGLRLLIQALS